MPINNKTFLLIAGTIIIAGGSLFYWKSTQKNTAEDFNLGNDAAVNKNFEERALQAELNCDPNGGHTNFRTQQAFAIDPNNPKVMYLGTEYKGVYKSTDGGVTWTKSDEGILGYYKKGTKEKCVQEMGKIVIDPTDSQRLMVSRVESPGPITDWFSETAGVYLSEDAGKTWKQLVKGDMNASGSKAIAFDPSAAKTIFYGTNNSPSSYGGADKTKFYNKVGILYKSTDLGKTWTELATGIDNYLRASDVLFDKANPKKVFFGTFRPSGKEGDRNLNTDQSKSLLLSEDSGKTWKSISNRIPESTAVVDISQSAQNPLNMFIIGQSIDSNTPSKTFYSKDGGNTFLVSPAASVYAASYDPHVVNGQRLLSYQPFANNPGLHESLDGGVTWSFYAKLPSVVDGSKVRISNITWDPVTPNVVYANGDYGYLLKSTDNGKTWSILTSQKDR